MALLGPDGNPVHNTGTPGGPDTGTPREEEPEQDSPREDEPEAPTRVVTAFLAYQMPNGAWAATEDLAAAVVPSRRPLPDDLIGGCHNIAASAAARKSAEMAATMTVQTQIAMARQAQEAAENEHILGNLARAGRR